MAVESDLATWLADGVRLLGGAIRELSPGLVEVAMPPEGWAELEGRILSPFVPQPAAPPRAWALTEEAWQRTPEAEGLAPGSTRFRQWTDLARRRAPALVVRWVSRGPTTLAPVLHLLWRVESNGSGRLAWTLASTTILPAGPITARPAPIEPLWMPWMNAGHLTLENPGREAVRSYRQAFDLTVGELAGWLGPRASQWAREQRRRWEAERLQVDAYHRALLAEDPNESAREGMERHLKELERNLAPRLRARLLLGLLLYLPPEQASALLDPDAGGAGRSGSSEARSASERAPHSGQAPAEGGVRPGASARRQPSQVHLPQAVQEAEAQSPQSRAPQEQGPAQAGQRSLGQRQSRRRSDSRPHS